MLRNYIKRDILGLTGARNTPPDWRFVIGAASHLVTGMDLNCKRVRDQG